MEEGEKKLFDPDECLFCAVEIDEPWASPRHIFSKQWSHGTSLRVMFLCIGIVGVVGATYSALSDIGTGQSTSGAPTASEAKAGRVPAPSARFAYSSPFRSAAINASGAGLVLQPLANEPLDPAFVERCRESLADPRPDIPAAEVRAYLKALHETQLRRGA